MQTGGELLALKS